jgi:hypothetical protein
MAAPLSADPPAESRVAEPSTMGSNLNPGQARECRSVSAHDGPSRGLRGRGDDQVVRTPWPSLASNVYQQLSVGLGRVAVIVEDRYHLEDIIHEGTARRSNPPRRQQYTDS